MDNDRAITNFFKMETATRDTKQADQLFQIIESVVAPEILQL